MKAIIPYLNFDGNCREAMEFYQKHLGGELSVSTFGEAPFDSPPGTEDRVINAHLSRGAFTLMASDTMPDMEYRRGNDVWLSLECESVDEVERLHEELSEGGRSVMGPHDAFWGARFAMIVDPFGMHWMLSFPQPAAG